MERQPPRPRRQHSPSVLLTADENLQPPTTPTSPTVQPVKSPPTGATSKVASSRPQSTQSPDQGNGRLEQRYDKNLRQVCLQPVKSGDEGHDLISPPPPPQHLNISALSSAFNIDGKNLLGAGSRTVLKMLMSLLNNQSNAMLI